MPIQYHHYLIAVTFILSLLYFKVHLKKSVEFLLQLLLFLNFVSEIIANIKWYIFKSSNIMVYNIVVGYTFVIWLLLLQIMYRGDYRKHIKYATYIFVLFYLVNICFVQGFQRFNTYSYLLGTLGTVFFTLKLLYNDILGIAKQQLTRFELLILYAGLTYFIGFSILFFTNEWNATKFEIFPDFTLYQLVAYSINSFFYGLIIWAIIAKRNFLLSKSC